MIEHRLKRAIEIFHSEGSTELVMRSLRFLHRQLPKGTTNYNGVKTKSCLLFDPLLPWRSPQRPFYESGLVSGIESQVKEDDEVVIVGGGWGVTAVKAAKIAGVNGRVTVFEGSMKEVKRVRSTVRINGVSDIVDVRHSVVGPGINLRGAASGASQVSPDELPDCDVLELDCEGAEIDILNNLQICPGVILVESHGIYEAPSAKVKEVLETKSYKIVSEEVADQAEYENCVDKDIYSIVGVWNGE